MNQEIPLHIIYQTYTVCGPIYKKLKASEPVTTDELVVLAEFIFFASLLGDLDKTLVNNRYLREAHSALVFAVKREYSTLNRKRLMMLRRGYVAACIVLESSTNANYMQAVIQIQQLQRKG